MCRQRLAGQVYGRATEGLFGEGELVAVALGEPPQTAHGLGGDLRADAIARQYGDVRLHGRLRCDS